MILGYVYRSGVDTVLYRSTGFIVLAADSSGSKADRTVGCTFFGSLVHFESGVCGWK
jgi:hypothetical protein